MLKRSAIHATMFAGAVTLALAVAAPAHGAVVEWYAGPVGMSVGKMVQVGISDPDQFSCTIGIRILASPKTRVGTSLTNALLSNVVNTTRTLPPLRVQAVGYHDPDITAGERRLAAAKVTANCPNTSAASVRELAVTMQIVDVTSGETTLVVQAPAE